VVNQPDERALGGFSRILAAKGFTPHRPLQNALKRSWYMNLDCYRRVLCQKCPDARLHFSKFGREVKLAEIAAS
jgi:hypothetical protein